jgi:hypothetical protein
MSHGNQTSSSVLCVGCVTLRDTFVKTCREPRGKWGSQWFTYMSGKSKSVNHRQLSNLVVTIVQKKRHSKENETPIHTRSAQ